MTSIDRREEILSRLFTVLQTVPGVEICVRNRGELPDDKRPAIVLLDSSEESTALTKVVDKTGRLSAPPDRMTLKPEIYISMDGRKPNNISLGQDLNVLRRAILKAVWGDDTLKALVGTSGDIVYNGCVTDLSKQFSMDGEMGIILHFIYLLKLDEL